MTGWAKAEEATAAKIYLCKFCGLHIHKGARYMRRGDVRDGVYVPQHAHTECHHYHMRAERDGESTRRAGNVSAAARAKCHSSEPHNDSGSAKRAAGRMRSRHRVKGRTDRKRKAPNVRTYKCKVCSYWHIGKQ